MKNKLLCLLFLTISYASQAQLYPSNDSLWYYDNIVYNGGDFTNPITGKSGCTLDDAGLQYASYTYADAYDGAFEFFVNMNDSVYTESGDLIPGGVDTTGTTITLSEQLIDGFYVSKSYFFSTTQPVVRVLYKIRNPTGAAKSTKIGVSSNLGSDMNTDMDTSFTNSDTLVNADRWMVTWDGYAESDPILTWSRFGPGSISSSPIFGTKPDLGNDKFIDTFAIIIPANSYSLIMQLSRMDSSTAAARAYVGTFNTVNGIYAAGLLDGLTSNELSKIVNWDFSSILCAVDMVNLTASASNLVVTANQSGATYIWLDCNNGNSIISGETNQNYTATANGSYSVIINYNACHDTTNCVVINNVGINEAKNNTHLNVYPNPNNGVFTIQATSEGVYTIVNELGQAIYSADLNAKNQYTMNIETLSNGIYFIVGNNNGIITKQKIVVVK